MRVVGKLFCVVWLSAMSLAFGGCERPAGKPAPVGGDSKLAQKKDANKAPADSTAKDVVATATAAKDDAAKPTNRVLLGSPELTAGIPGEGTLQLAEIEAWLADPRNHAALEIELPLGLAASAAGITGLDENPLTRAKIELGRQLYFDPRLSADGTISCASCHHPDSGYARQTQFGVGIRGQMGGRNSPVSYNRIFSGKQFWDGRADSLEAQAIGPIANPIEMGHTHEACVESLQRIDGYALQFEKIFGEPVTIANVGKALASFERALVTGPSPYDYFARVENFEKLDQDDLKEDPQLWADYQRALADANAHPASDSAKRGRDLFFSEKANCTACHVGANFTDEKYHNLGIGMDKEPDKIDLGLEAITKNEKDRGAFKTPTIRNVALSAPYMHDGSVATLEEVVEWYAKGGHPNPNLSDKIKKLALTDQYKADLVEFMRACTGEFPKVQPGRLPE